jgi:hypothetical protein
LNFEIAELTSKRSLATKALACNPVSGRGEDAATRSFSMPPTTVTKEIKF